MTNARARLALLCALACLVTGAAVPAQANAVVSYYNCVMKPSNLWCDGRANGSFDAIDDYDFNEGWYPGTWDGSVTACQRLYDPGSGTTLSGSSCAANYSGTDYGTISSNWEANVKQISGGDHSVNGSANTDF